jgi:hypothetical protein
MIYWVLISVIAAIALFGAFRAVVEAFSRHRDERWIKIGMLIFVLASALDLAIILIARLK